MSGSQSRFLREENSRTALTALANSSRSSSEDDLEHNSKTPQFLAAFLATLGAFSVGCVMGWTSPALPLLEGRDSPLPITSQQGSWLGSLVNLGALLGAAPAGAVAQRVGRQRLLTFLSLPMLASWLLVALGNTITMLYVARFMAGLCAGAISVAAPMYTGEIADQKCRGALGTFFQLQLTMGILFVYALGTVAPLRCLSYSCAVIPALFLVTFMWMPETPQFLLSQGRRCAAEKSLQWLRGSNTDVQKELLVMQSAIQEAEADSVGYAATLKMFLTERATRKALIIAYGLMIFQQLSGINVVIFYSGSIFGATGGALSPAMASLVVAVVQVVVTFGASLLVDRTGRKPLLLFSSSLMALCLAGLATSFTYPLDARPAWLEWLPLASVTFFIVAFSIGFGPIPWMMMGELFSSSAKGAASATTASLNWILAFVVTKAFQSLLELMGPILVFGEFATICVIGSIFVVLVVPETKGKSLQEIQSDLAGSRKHVSLSPI